MSTPGKPGSIEVGRSILSSLRPDVTVREVYVVSRLFPFRTGNDGQTKGEKLVTV